MNNEDDKRPTIGGMDFDIRPPDESRFATLLEFERPNPNQRRRVRISGRRETSGGGGGGRGRGVRPHVFVEQDDEAYLNAIMESTRQQEEMELENILRESAEEYERNCMSMCESESDASIINIARKLPCLKMQCKKLGRFDAELASLLKCIQSGEFNNINATTMKNKLQQVRMPADELHLINNILHITDTSNFA